MRKRFDPEDKNNDYYYKWIDAAHRLDLSHDNVRILQGKLAEQDNSIRVMESQVKGLHDKLDDETGRAEAYKGWFRNAQGTIDKIRAERELGRAAYKMFLLINESE